MNALKRLLRLAFWLAVFVFLCGFLPRIVPAVLPTITVEAEPVFCIGGDLLHHCEGGFGVTNSMVATLIVDALLIILFLIAARRPKLIPSGIQNFFEAIIDILYNQCRQVAGENAARIFPIGATIFLFVFFANYMELLPAVESVGYVHHAEGNVQGYELDRSTPEGSAIVFLNPRCPVITEDAFDRLTPAAQQARADAGCQPPVKAGEGEGEENKGWTVVPTVRTASTDINVTLALALVTFAATQVWGVINHIPHGRKGVVAVLVGIKRYLNKFFNTGGFRRDGVGKVFGAIDFFASILEGLAEFVRVVAFTFRLFGNIFAGTVLIFVVMSLVPYVGPVATLLLETFVGLIQAYVFMMLAFVFMNAAAQVHGDHAEAAH